MSCQDRMVNILSPGGHSQEMGHSSAKPCIWTGYVNDILHFVQPASDARADQSYLRGSYVCSLRKHCHLHPALFDRHRKPDRLPGHYLLCLA